MYSPVIQSGQLIPPQFRSLCGKPGVFAGNPSGQLSPLGFGIIRLSQVSGYRIFYFKSIRISGYPPTNVSSVFSMPLLEIIG